jgi:hypothetical protein
MSDRTYNGWRNFETWRVYLELFDGDSRPNATAESVREEVREFVDSHLPSEVRFGAARGILQGWIECFLAEVDWEEVASSIREEEELEELEDGDGLEDGEDPAENQAGENQAENQDGEDPAGEDRPIDPAVEELARILDAAGLRAVFLEDPER